MKAEGRGVSIFSFKHSRISLSQVLDSSGAVSDTEGYDTPTKRQSNHRSMKYSQLGRNQTQYGTLHAQLLSSLSVKDFHTDEATIQPYYGKCSRKSYSGP